MGVIHLRKIIYVFMLCLLLVGCSASGEGNNVTMDSYVTEFEGAGMPVGPDKPMFSLIGAKDGVMFENDKKVVVYEFDSQKAIKTAEESLPAVKGWERNGLFVLESSDEKAIEIFNSVK